MEWKPWMNENIDVNMFTFQGCSTLFQSDENMSSMDMTFLKIVNVFVSLLTVFRKYSASAAHMFT